MKNTIKVLGIIAIIAVIGFSMAACDNGGDGGGGGGGGGGGNGNKTPVAGDYTIGNLEQTAGSVTAVTITPKDGKSTGAVSNIKYAGNAGIPQAVGTYAVTFDVAAVTGWNAATNLSAGTLNVKSGSGGEGDVDYTAASVEDLQTWLADQPYTNPTKAYTVKLNVDDISNIKTAIGTDKYVNLDLSESTITSIGENAFSYCQTLTGITLPDSVTSIGNSAFRTCTELTSVNIPDSVTRIDTYAFQDCIKLTSITLPDSVTSIGAQAFSGCKVLTSVTIPDSVTSIGYLAFGFCTSLTEINVDTANTAYSSQAGVLYNKDKTTLIQYPAGKADSTFTILDSVTSIGSGVFYGCTELTSITIPNSVTRINTNAFADCTNLTSVTIGSGVTSIGSDIFQNCTNLASVNIGSGVTSIDSRAFQTCTGLLAINVDTANTKYNSQNGVLYNKEKTYLLMYPLGKTDSSFTIPSGVTTIGDDNNYFNGISVSGFSSFNGNTIIANITIPSTVKKINGFTFAGCTNLTSVTFQGTFPNNYYSTFNNNAFGATDGKGGAYIGDLGEKFFGTNVQGNNVGTPGTYTREANGTTWTKTE